MKYVILKTRNTSGKIDSVIVPASQVVVEGSGQRTYLTVINTTISYKLFSAIKVEYDVIINFTDLYTQFVESGRTSLVVDVEWFA
jgi:hypothetical protein